jgi:hypothetical protein
MALEVTGAWTTKTAANNVGAGQTVMSFMAVIVPKTFPTGSANFIYKPTAASFLLSFVTSSSVVINITPQSGAIAQKTNAVTAGTQYVFIITMNGANWACYSNGVQNNSGTNLTSATNAGNSIITLGWLGTGTLDCVFDRIAVWNGYSLTATDVVNLSTFIQTPLQISTPATAYWTFAGTPGTNPQVGDAALNDLSGHGYNFTSITGALALANYVAPLTYQPGYTATGILGRDRQTVYFLLNDVSGLQVPQAVTAVNSNPTINVNGSPVSVTGPTWTNTTHNSCFAAYYLPSQVLPTDILTWSAAFGWITAGGLSSPLAVTNGTIVNSGGNLEPQIGNWSASIPVAPWNPVQKTMPIGINTNNAPAISYSTYWLQQNGLRNCKNPWSDLSGHSCTSTLDGWPTATTVTGIAAAVPCNTISTNSVDGQQNPTQLGTYTYQDDESNPAAPMNVSLISLNTAPNNGIITGGLTFAGTLTNGVLVGRQWQWNVQLAPGYTIWSLQLAIQISNPTGLTGSQPNTLIQRSAVLTRPLRGGIAQTPNTTNPAYPDQQFIASLFAPNGRTPFSLRGGDTTWANDGNSAVGQYADAQSVKWFSWAQNNQAAPPSGPSNNVGGAPRKITVTEIRPYSLAAAPNIIMPDSYGGHATPVGDGTYQVTPPSNTFWVGGVGGMTAQWAMFEAVTAAPHGLTTGQLTSNGWTGANTATLFTNSNGNQAAGSIFTSLFALNSVVWVTSPTSFMTTFFWQVSGGVGNCTNDNTGLNNVISQQAPDASSVPVALFGSVGAQLGIHRLNIEIPFPFSTQSAISLVQSALVYYPDCPEIVLAMGNETWSGQAQGQYYLAQLAALFGIGTGSFHYGLVWRSDQLRTAVATAVANAGYRTKISIALITQAVSPSITASYITAANALGIKIDYILSSGYDHMIPDSTILTAGTTWKVGSLVDLHRWYLCYNTSLNGPGGQIQGHSNACAQMTPPPVLANYEGSLENAIAKGTTNQGPLLHDAWYHPYIYDDFNTHMSVYQTNGTAWFTMTYYSNVAQGSSPNCNRWMMYEWQGQAAGRGDGSHGGVVNQFATAQGGAPADGKCHAGPDGINQWGNDSVIGQAFLDWAAVANPAPALSMASAGPPWYPPKKSAGRHRLGSRS